MHHILEVPQTHRNILDHLEGVDTPFGTALTPENWAKGGKYMGEGEVNLTFY